ncbi:MAG: hypothetical protein ACRESI_07270 [Gammaproteobacteria bacterium]
MAENEISERLQVVRKTPPVSRALRLLIGSWLLFEVAVNIHRPDWKAVLIVSCTFIAVFFYYALLHLLIGQSMRKWAVMKVVTLLPAVVFFFSVLGTDIPLGILAFFGVSLVVQALRGDRGCEVMTLPNLVFRRRANFPCLLFSPLDRFEESIYRAIRGH